MYRESSIAAGRVPEKSPGKETTYRSYLLRLWRDREGRSWRATLESPTDREQMAFAQIQDLFVYLAQQTGAQADNLNETACDNRLR